MALLGGNTPTNITSATTTTISAAPASTGKRRVGEGMISIHNAGAVTQNCTLQMDRSASTFERQSFPVGAGQTWTNTGADAWDVVQEDTDKIELVTDGTSSLKVIVSYLGN
jgi:hypothetical protein